jgi:LCP family protein required for cell wall assembly
VPVEIPESEPPRPTHKARERVRQRQEDRRLPRIEWTWIVIGLAVVGVIGVLAQIFLTSSGPTAASETLSPTLVTGQGTQVAVSSLPTLDVKPWDGKRRMTVLVMGLDKRPGEQGTGFRTDSLILVSVDPATQRIGMVSIPRDLQMPIPGQDGMKPINTAYVLGELARPGSGARMAADAIQYNLGIPVNHYVVVSFSTVINLVDAIGGITIEVKAPIDDKEYPAMEGYGYDPLYIPAGTIQMDGQLALKYARTRHQSSDFDRALRQQQVIMAIRKKALQADTWPGLIVKAPVIWNEVSQGVITDFSFEEVVSIVLYLKDIPATNIQRGSIDGNYTQAVQYNGQSVITVNRNTITELMTNVFGANYNQ